MGSPVGVFWQRVGAATAAILPGALAGAQLALILFFLNPALPFGSGLLGRSLLLFSVLIGLPIGALLWVAGRGKPKRIWRAFPYAITAALALSAVGFWVHGHLYQAFLPPGIVSRLLKAAVAITLATLACFYTIVWNRWRKRDLPWHNQLLVISMAALSLSVVVERREAFRPKTDSFRQTTFEGRKRPFLCVVGIDSASLDVILPLTEKGRLPFFNQILQSGARASVISFRPPRPKALWLTLATGKLPYKHGILDEHVFQTPLLDQSASLRLVPSAIGFGRWTPGLEQRQVDAHDLLSLPIWRMLARLGVPTAVVDWPLTAPVPPEVPIAVSDRYFREIEDGVASTGDDLASVERSIVSSAEIGQRVALFHLRPQQIDPGITQRFGAPAAIADSTLRNLAGDLWREDFATWLAAPDQNIEALFVYLPGLRPLSESSFADFSATQFEGDSSAAKLAAAQQLAAYYAHLDAFLARLWAAQTGSKWLVVASANGVADTSPGERLDSLLASLGGNTSPEADGLFLFLGEGIEPGVFVRKAYLADLVPTLLYGMGLPIARDLDGNVLSPVFQTSFIARQPLTFVPSYETLVVAGESGSGLRP